MKMISSTHHTVHRPGSVSRRGFLQAGAGVVLAGCAPASPSPESASTSSTLPKEQPNIVVLLSDTLRADRVGCYGYDKPTSPAMDAFAERAIQYKTCVAQASWTKPSIGSLWTGYPADIHQAIVSNAEVPRADQAPNVHVLRRQFPTLAEVLAAAGYTTGLYLSNPQVQQEYGFAQGFHHYRYEFMEDPVEQTTEAIRWIRSVATEPFFLFLHVIDPHAPYLPDAADFERLHGRSIAEDRVGLPEDDLALLAEYDAWYEAFPAEGKERPKIWSASDEAIAHLERAYVAEIPRVDRQLQRLVEALEEDELAERTVTVMTSDHGEAFNEHGWFQHGMSLFGEELHVPLLISGPDITPGVVDTPVALSDLYPTLAAMAGAPSRPNRWHGALPGLPGQPPPEDRCIHAMTNCFDMDMSAWKYAMYDGHMKIIEESEWRGVFDLAADPGEHNNLLETPGAEETAVRSLLERYEAERTKLAEAAEAHGEAEWTSMSDADRQQLEALGYVF